MYEDLDAAELSRLLRTNHGAEQVHLALWIQRLVAPRTRVADRAFGVLLAFLARTLGSDADAQDDAQETALKVLEVLSKARLETPKGSAAWLRRVAKNVRRDRFRRERTKQGVRQGYGHEQEVQRQGTSAAGHAAEDAPPSVEPYRAALFTQLDTFFETRQRRARVSGRRNAELAWLRHVTGRTRAELAAGPGSAARNMDTLSQWIKRGREEVILPCLRRWRDAVAAEEDGEALAHERMAIGAMIHFFEQARRADAGRARPARRQNVSPESSGTSVQVEKAGVVDQDGHVMEDGEGDE